MNAEEAKRKALEAAFPETNMILELISAAVIKGQFSLELPIPIMEATQKYLEEKGFSVKWNGGSDPKYINWVVKIYWDE